MIESTRPTELPRVLDASRQSALRPPIETAGNPGFPVSFERMTGPEKLQKQLVAHAAQLTLLSRETDRRLADVNRRLDNLAARGALIVSAAAIATGVQVSAGTGLWLVLAAGASLAAALVALPLLVFKRGLEVNVSALTKSVGTFTKESLELELINAKAKLISEAESWMG